MNVLKDYSKASFLLWLVGVKFCIFFINPFTMVVYTELSVGSTLTWNCIGFSQDIYLLLFH